MLALVQPTPPGSLPINTVSPTPNDAFTAIAHPVRRQLLDALQHGDQPVHQLAQPFALTRPAISQHLKILRDAGLVVEQRVGRERRYYLQAEQLQEAYDWLAQYEHFWRTRLQRLGNYLDEHHGS
jgi:DNA-binding transcriptional ArsR family regulator